MTYLRISVSEWNGNDTVKGHGKGFTVYSAKTDQVLPILFDALKKAGYKLSEKAR